MGYRSRQAAEHVKCVDSSWCEATFNDDLPEARVHYGVRSDEVDHAWLIVRNDVKALVPLDEKEQLAALVLV